MPPESVKLPSHFNLEPELLEQLGMRTGPQRCIEGHDELLLFVHEVPEGVVPGNVMIFWRRHDGRWNQAGGPGINELDDLLGRYEDVINSRFAAVNRAEDVSEVFAAQRHSAPLLRSIRDLIKAFEQVLAFDPNDRGIVALRDRAKEIEVAADLLQSDARVTLEFLRTRQGEELISATEHLGKSVGRLTLIVLVFLPLTALGSFLVMSGTIPALFKVLFWILFSAGVLTATAKLLPGFDRKRESLIRKDRSGE